MDPILTFVSDLMFGDMLQEEIVFGTAASFLSVRYVADKDLPNAFVWTLFTGIAVVSFLNGGN